MYQSIITDQISEDLERALQVAKEHGYHHVELHNVFGKSVEQCNEEEIKEIQRLMKKYDMQVCSIASTVFFLCPLLEQDQVSLFNPSFYAITGGREEHLAYLKNACKVAKALDCPRIRIFPFRFPDNRAPYYGTEEQMEIIIDSIRPAVQIAEQEGVMLVLENCPYSHLPKGEMTIQVVQRIQSPNLRLLWDPANSYRAYKQNVPPKYLQTPLIDELKNIYPYIDHIHIKDYFYDETLEKPFKHVALSKGDIPFEELFDYLHRQGYQNAVSLEAETEYDLVIESMEEMNRLVAR